jgi:aspartyl-tRNA(Asn)/glutamyl-tRNA(Gln) amidotransferase subunit A
MTVGINLSARDIVARVQNQETRAVDVADEFLTRIARYDDKLKAFATVKPDLVRADAAHVDTYVSAGARLPLSGVPVGIKDIIDVAGYPTIAGFEPFRSTIADRDAAIVSRLRSLGAVILGKAHTTQFAVGDPAPTGNPWNLAKSPAGSSAGSGAAVAARMAPITVGSQTAGSMLRPAAFSGAVGMKPTYGWFPVDGVLPLCWSLDHLGLYGAAVDDVTLVYNALLGIDAEDAPDAPRTPRVALLTDLVDMSDSEVANHLRSVAARLSDAGAVVDEQESPVPFRYLHAVHQVIFSAETAATHSANMEKYREEYNPRIRMTVDAGTLVPGVFVEQARRHRRIIAGEFDRFLGQYDALLFPTVTTEACDREETGDRSLQVPATLLGLPAISLPTGLSENTLPLSTQLVGRRGFDSQLLSLAEWVSSVIPLIDQPDLDQTLR